MSKILLQRPTGFWDNSRVLPIAAQMAGYEYWDEGKNPDPLLVRRDGDVFVVVKEWRTPPIANRAAGGRGLTERGTGHIGGNTQRRIGRAAGGNSRRVKNGSKTR